MNKKLFLISIILCALFITAAPIDVKAFAYPAVMDDGEVFDAQYYATQNPDVASNLGYDAEVLYKHYKMFGKDEGRKPYAANTAVTLVKAEYAKAKSRAETQSVSDGSSEQHSQADMQAQIEALLQAGNSVNKQKPVYFNQTVNDNRIRKCAIVTGDSRTVSIICTLLNESAFKRTYYSNDGISSTAILMNDSTVILITGEASGDITNGAYDRAFQRVIALLGTENELINCSTYTYCNLFAVNDLLIHREKSGMKYIATDEQMILNLPRFTRFYQFNAGPISDKGWEYEYTTNEDIEKYNADIISSELVTVVDLYGYLMNTGFGVVLDASDLSGVHYDTLTNKKIIKLILSYI